MVTFVRAELASDVPFGSFPPIPIRISFPALIRAYANLEHVTGFESPSPGQHSFFDQLYGQCSVLARDQSSSSSPQIASAFFYGPSFRWGLRFTLRYGFLLGNRTRVAVDTHTYSPGCFAGRSLWAGRLLKWSTTPVFLLAACERPVRLSCELEEVGAELSRR